MVKSELELCLPMPGLMLIPHLLYDLHQKDLGRNQPLRPTIITIMNEKQYQLKACDVEKRRSPKKHVTWNQKSSRFKF